MFGRRHSTRHEAAIEQSHEAIRRLTEFAAFLEAYVDVLCQEIERDPDDDE